MKPSITYADFDKLDLRIGTVVAASVPTWSKKLIRFEVDFGADGKRVIFSGIKEWYAPEEFIGKQYPFLVNLEPKNMGPAVEETGVPEASQGMMLMADGDERPVIFSIDPVDPGTVVR